MTDWNRWRATAAREHDNERRWSRQAPPAPKAGGFLPLPAATPPRADSQFVGWKATGGILVFSGLMVAGGYEPIIGVVLLVAGVLAYATGQLRKAVR